MYKLNQRTKTGKILKESGETQGSVYDLVLFVGRDMTCVNLWAIKMPQQVKEFTSNPHGLYWASETHKL